MMNLEKFNKNLYYKNARTAFSITTRSQTITELLQSKSESNFEEDQKDHEKINKPKPELHMRELKVKVVAIQQYTERRSLPYELAGAESTSSELQQLPIREELSTAKRRR
jgi:hypothetical protein